MNKVITVTQCTIAWYADDKKLLHKNIEVISDMVNVVKKKFEELSVVIGIKHTLLGMNIEIKDNMIQVDIVNQLEECIEMFGEDISALFTSPANKILL